MTLYQISLDPERVSFAGGPREGDARQDRPRLLGLTSETKAPNRIAVAERDMAKTPQRSVAVECGSCPARRDGLCGAASPERLNIVKRHKWGDRKVRAGEDLISLGSAHENIYNLVEGWMLLYNLSADGRRQILHFALPGAVLGFDPAPSISYGVQALTDATVCAIPRKALPTLSNEIPGIGLRLAWLMTRDRCSAFDHLTNIGRRSARERVACLLLELFVRYRGQWLGNRIEEMRLPLTQEHIGDATGLTFVHVNRVLRELRKDGIAEFHYRRLRIINPDKLIDVAGVDPQLAMSWMRRGQGE